jgi:hypothetical protein
VESELVWRLPVFEGGKYLIAFDGAALLLLELSRRLVEGETKRQGDMGTRRGGVGSGQQAGGSLR